MLCEFLSRSLFVMRFWKMYNHKEICWFLISWHGQWSQGILLNWLVFIFFMPPKAITLSAQRTWNLFYKITASETKIPWVFLYFLYRPRLHVLPHFPWMMVLVRSFTRRPDALICHQGLPQAPSLRLCRDPVTMGPGCLHHRHKPETGELLVYWAHCRKNQLVSVIKSYFLLFAF